MWNGQTVSVVLPAYNEIDNIAQCVQDYLDTGLVDEVVVADNNSTDGTPDAVRKTSATLVTEERQGYGAACQRALHEASSDLILLCEPDGTFLARDISKMLSYAEDFDIVFGTRTTSTLINDGANMGFFLKWGNWAVAKMLEVLFAGPSLTDVGCTMRLLRRSALARIQPYFTVHGNYFSPEMMVLALILKLRCVEVPVNYGQRVGTSKITGTLSGVLQVGCHMIGLILWYRLTWWKVRGKHEHTSARA